MRWRGLEPPRPCGHKALNLARLPIPPPARGVRSVPPACSYSSSRKRMTVLRKNATATTTVRRVRFRSTMCVPPCEAGVKPSPPNPVSRPECIKTSAIKPAEMSTCETAKTWIIAAGMVATCPLGYGNVMVAGDDARAKIQRLLVTGDNRLKQGVAPEKARESYAQALAVAREAGLEDSVGPLVELRLADLARFERTS
jgi:hypothetical protein